MPSAIPPGETCWVSRVVVCPVALSPIVISLRYITIPLAWRSGGQKGQTYATDSGGPGIAISSVSRIAGSKVCPGRKGGPSGFGASAVAFGQAPSGPDGEDSAYRRADPEPWGPGRRFLVAAPIQ